MAGESEGQRRGEAADPVAVALALGAVAHNERVAVKAEAFLEKQAKLSDRQSALIELQAEELRRELKLHHWSARIHHVSSILKLAFEFALAVIFLGVVVLIGGSVWNAVNDRGLVIEAFQVPPDLASRGLTGDVVASRLLDKLTAMQNVTQSARPAQSYANDWGDDIKVQIPDTGVSIGEFNHYLHAWLGHQTRIAGDVYRTANGIAVTARIGGGDSATFDGPETALDALLQRAAEHVYRQTQPYRYTAYVIHGPAPNVDEVRQVLSELTQNPDPEERAWAWVGLGNIAAHHDGDARRGLADIHKALAEKPGLLLALMHAAGIDRILGHSEAFLADVRAERRAVSIRPASDPDWPRIRWLEMYREAISAALLGHYGAAITVSRRGEQLSLNSDEAEDMRDIAMLGLASLHDGKAARVAARSLPPLSPSELESSADRAQAEMQMNVLLGNWRVAVAQEPLGETLQIRGYPGFDNRIVVATQLRPWLALAKAELGDFASARAAIGSTPGDCYDCVRMRGKIAALAHRWDPAAYWFAIAVKQGPSLPFADTEWGDMLLHRGDYDSAIAKFALAHAKGPHFADPLEMWGEALMQKNRSDLALAKFAEANKYAPNWGRLHLEWAKGLLWSGDKAGAKKQFEIASHLELNPADAANLKKQKVAL